MRFPTLLVLVLVSPIWCAMTLRVHRNGNHSQTVELSVESLGDLHEKVPSSLHDAETDEALHFYDAMGNRIRSLTQVKANDDIYVVPSSRFFVWPFHGVGHKLTLPHISDTSQPVVMEALSDSPRVFLLHNLFNDEEAQQILRNAEPEMLRSTTGTKVRELRNLSDESSFTSIRTSLNSWDMDSDVAMRLKRRSFKLARIEPFDDDLSDGLQVLKYEPPQAYEAHEDYFEPGSEGTHNFDPREGGSNRYATVFLYFSDVDDGGETVFPRAAPLSEAEISGLLPESKDMVRYSISDEAAAILPSLLPPKRKFERKLVRQCRTSLCVQPRKGKALIFYSQTPEGYLDPQSLHGACPVLRGTKWAANLWLWNGIRSGAEGAPQIDNPYTIHVEWTNNLPHAGILRWRNPDDNSMVHMADLEPGESVISDTFHYHEFVFEAGGESFTRIIEVEYGLEQSVVFPPPEPVEDNEPLDIEAPLPHTHQEL